MHRTNLHFFRRNYTKLLAFTRSFVSTSSISQGEMDVSQQKILWCSRFCQYITGGNGRFPAIPQVEEEEIPVYHRGKWTFPSLPCHNRHKESSISQGEMDVSQPTSLSNPLNYQYITGGNGRFPAWHPIPQGVYPVYHRGKWTFPSGGLGSVSRLTSISQGEMDVSQQWSSRPLRSSQYITGGNGRFPARFAYRLDRKPVYHRGKWTFPSFVLGSKPRISSISQGEMDVSQPIMLS